MQKQKALEFGESFANERGMQGVRITVHPRPPTPFNWTVFVSDDDAHRFSHINLVRTEAKRYQPGDGFIARIDSPYLPLAQAVWVRRTRYGETDQDFIREAWSSEALAVYRWFADLPAFDGLSRDPACAFFVDLRFLTPGRDAMPFRYGACRDPIGAWRLLVPE